LIQGGYGLKAGGYIALFDKEKSSVQVCRWSLTVRIEIHITKEAWIKIYHYKNRVKKASDGSFIMSEYMLQYWGHLH
jgi:hypothetical protein